MSWVEGITSQELGRPNRKVEQDFVRMIGQRPLDYSVVDEKLRRIKDHSVFLQIWGEKKLVGASSHQKGI